MTRLLILDGDRAEDLIHERKRLGIDKYDEVWEGVYVIPSMPTNAQQELVGDLGSIFGEVLKRKGLGRTYPGANVSDRRKSWKHNHRVPDIVVVLNNGRAIDCGTHFFGGPDFLVEIESPGDETEEKVPFYRKIGVRVVSRYH